MTRVACKGIRQIYRRESRSFLVRQLKMCDKMDALRNGRMTVGFPDFLRRVQGPLNIHRCPLLAPTRFVGIC